MKPTESTSGNSVSPTESTTGSTLLPTESMTGSTMKPTESTSGSTLSTTKSTTESRTNAPSVHSVVVLLVVLVGVMVFTTLLVTCLLCVYRKPWKRDQSSIVSPNTCTHLNHASAPVVANLYSDMTSGDENVVHMSSLENIGPMADSDHWPTLTVRQGHSAVKYSVSRVENGEGGCPGDSAYAQLDIPRRERDSADYWEVEVGEEDSFCVVHSQVNHDDVMLQELTLQKTSQTCHIAASPTDHPPRHLRTCEMGFAGSDNGDVFEESSIYEPLSTFNRLSVRRTDETYTSFEQQELNVKPDIQKTNKSYYFEKEPLYLKNESKAAFDKLSYTSENTDNPYIYLSRTELRVTFTQDCDLQEQCERSDTIHGRHDDHQTVTEADEDKKSGHSRTHWAKEQA
ncbi:uncharacterized protein LOC124260423 [Haliotis rubra]|uniref:uncharacterized protein LOC124260423 n=1 Tax=Haliotis rubra TaxID=36100 RepID=UPI001EE531AD|nr:uncharacterized protein LOC124260423 [Haliotis rubra]